MALYHNSFDWESSIDNADLTNHLHLVCLSLLAIKKNYSETKSRVHTNQPPYYPVSSFLRVHRESFSHLNIRVPKFEQAAGRRERKREGKSKREDREREREGETEKGKIGGGERRERGG